MLSGDDEDGYTYLLHVREGCPYCEAAINVLKDNSQDYCVIIHENREAPGLIKEQKLWDWKTVPLVVRVSVNEVGDTIRTLVGGYTDLCESLKIKPEI